MIDEGGFDARGVARDGARCAARLVQDDGAFIYAYDADTRAPVHEYDLIRHSSTCWAIAQTANRFGDMEVELESADRAMAWLLEKHTYRMGPARSVVQGDSIFLGASALAMLALVELAKADADGQRRLDVAKDFADFVLACRREDGDFYHRIDLKMADIDPWRSEFYTGEALFALVRTSQATSQARYLDVAADTLAKLDGQNHGIANHSHWIAYALSALHETTGEERLVAYAGRIVRSILDNPGYRDYRASTALACRAEALAAYGDMLVRTEGQTPGPRWAEVMQALRENLTLLMEFRLDDGAFVLGDAHRSVRIDVIQHAVAAFLGYDRLSAHRLD